MWLVKMTLIGRQLLSGLVRIYQSSLEIGQPKYYARQCAQIWRPQKFIYEICYWPGFLLLQTCDSLSENTDYHYKLRSKCKQSWRKNCAHWRCLGSCFNSRNTRVTIGWHEENLWKFGCKTDVSQLGGTLKLCWEMYVSQLGGTPKTLLKLLVCHLTTNYGVSPSENFYGELWRISKW